MKKDCYLHVEPNVKIHYYDEGTGRPLVFIPGWMFNCDVFEKQFAYFSKIYRCIAMDPRSQGKSSITEKKNSYVQQGDDIHSLIDHLKLNNVVLIGWSFGAIACWNYLEKFGFEKISGSVTIDNSPRSITDDEKEYRAGTIDGLRKDHQNSLCSDKAFRQFMGGFADQLLYENKMDPEYRQELIDSACNTPCEIADILYVDGWLSDKREIVHKIDNTIPSLLYIANYRKKTGVPYMKKEYPNTEIHAFGMHMMFNEYPDKFNEILENFIRNKIESQSLS